MKSLLEPPRTSEADPSATDNTSADRASVLQELDRILSSRHFRSADRCKEFLRYVVLNKLDGHTERLKERVIGTELFNRRPGYATGDDPVVRVQAGEVRRRLERCYQDAEQTSQLHIELPVGSYCPVFHPMPASEVPEPVPQPAAPAVPSVRKWKPYAAAVSALLVALLVFLAGRVTVNSQGRRADPKSALDQFWGPATASHQPILICVANVAKDDSPIIPAQPESSAGQAAGGRAASPGVQNLDPEIVPAADASVAVALSGLFGKLDRPSQLRIGSAARYGDLRYFPAVVIGGFNNRWTMQLLSSQHFAFVWENGRYMIREQVPGGRVWNTNLGPHGDTVEDFAIVSRLIDSKTGQFTVTVAGIGPRGTEAAGEFVSSSRDLQEGLARAPAGWQDRDLEILLQTTVTESVAGPPHVLATYTR
ncbi:MAG: hypothetical protein ACLGXA_04900 [Acidobacteriota bacterium]